MWCRVSNFGLNSGERVHVGARACARWRRRTAPTRVYRLFVCSGHTHIRTNCTTNRARGKKTCKVRSLRSLYILCVIGGEKILCVNIGLGNLNGNRSKQRVRTRSNECVGARGIAHGARVLCVANPAASVSVHPQIIFPRC